MKSYWLWLFFHLMVWLFALLYVDQTIEVMTWYLIGTACYFILFFIIPLFKEQSKLLLFILGLKSIIALLIAISVSSIGYNPFLLLVFSLVMAEGFYYLNGKDSFILGSFISISVIGATILTDFSYYIQIFIIIYFLLLFCTFVFYKKSKDHSDDLEARYDALLSEYRDIKRRRVSEEEVTRQEERMLIAHEIHDSVGHKLTALLMQLEAFRFDVAEKDRDRVVSLKGLAGESLAETRRAVKSLKSSETGGLPGILRLIRKLEMESFMRIHFSVKHGAFSAPLSGEQSFVIYRSVQEALTNIMKHSQQKVAEITFEAPGGSIFRFEVSNPAIGNDAFKEGFGLSSMRERLERYGGNLEVLQTDNEFIVRGSIKIG